jgi:pimeloyl-ACP methyl ester carboxylesterase
MWGDSQAPLVYLVHGWGGWRGQVAAFVPSLLAAGYRVLTFDALSHGESSPGRHGPHHSSGGELTESLMAVARQYGPAAGVIGHSLGCCATVLSIGEGALQAERLAMISPNPDMADIAVQFGHTLGLPQRTIERMLADMASWARRPMADFDIAQLTQRWSLPPALIVHDKLDREVRYRTALDIVEAWPNAQLLTTQGYGHHRILIAPEVVSAVPAYLHNGRGKPDNQPAPSTHQAVKP